MRHLVSVTAIVVVALVCVSCGESSTPASPSAAVTAVANTASGSGTTPIGVTGLIRGLDLRGGSFSLVARAGTYQVRMDSQTQVWSGGARVRATSLTDGQVVAIRGADYGSYVLAISISISR